MLVIVGLGNPGNQYARTRHNVGFDVVDVLIEKLAAGSPRRMCSALVWETRVDGERVALCKPQTYMNDSGRSVAELVSWYKPEAGRLLVVYDDIDLPLGKLRLRASGSAGTHNGMRSVVACVGSEDFPRVRIGVGAQRHGELKDFVLARPVGDERAAIAGACRNAADAARLIIAGRLADAQARYNRKHEGV